MQDTGNTTNDLTRLSVPLQGRRPVQVPDTTISLLANYRFTDGPLLGLALGGGVRYLGPSWGDPANTFQVPESVVVAGLTAELNINNLLDERFVSSCLSYSACFYGLPRTVYGTLRYRW